LSTEDATTQANVISTATDETVPLQRIDQAETDRSEDAALVARLREGDESAFVHVVDAWSPTMLRVARMFVSTDASAQEIVQEAWLAVVRGLDRFEGRSSLRTWVFRILTNLGKTRGVKEARAVPLSSLSSGVSTGPTVDSNRFRGADDEWPQHWTPVGSPRAWSPSPEDEALAGEIRGEVASALQDLPERQRTVVSLRDVHGMSADEVCIALEISAANQRVLLHRGQARLRETLEDYYRGLTPVMTS
jgi:RNA polymerase sigma-70 factor, ECF subfamily